MDAHSYEPSMHWFLLFNQSGISSKVGCTHQITITTDVHVKMENYKCDFDINILYEVAARPIVWDGQV